MNKSVLSWLFISVLSSLIIWQAWLEVKAQGADWLPVKYVRIEGAFQFIDKQQIKDALREHVMNGFYNVDIQQVQASVMQLPWADSVMVKRVWPDAINVVINEQKPLVRWGESALLNNRGEVFKPAEIADFKQLPLFIGPEGHQLKMLNIMKRLRPVLQVHDMQLAIFEVNKRRAWKIKLNNEMELNAGRNQPLNRIQRFLKTLALLGEEQIARIAVVDLRYSNGYALKWKKGEAEIDWKKIAEMKKT